MMCADLMMRRARLFGPLLASGCEVLISGEGTRRVRLFDGERALVGNATAKRRREFTETRLLAHEALRRIGHDGPILKGSDGEPLWPSGIVGSLSHCPSLCVAAVASAERIRAVGVDVDDSDGLSTGSCGSCSLPKSSHHCVWPPRWNVGRPSARRRPPRRRCPHWTGRGTSVRYP